MTRTTRNIEPLGRQDAVRVFMDDRDNWSWLYLHFAREQVAAEENGQGNSAWSYYLLEGMKAIDRKDVAGIESAICELNKLAQ